MANNIQLRDSSGALVNMRTLESQGVHTPYQIVSSVEKKFRDSFPGVAIDPLKWDTGIGGNGAIAVSGGLLTMGSGTTANAETYILSKETFRVPFRISFSLQLSQRIANTSFLVEAVSVNSVTGVPDGLHSISWLFDGTSATSAKYRVQNSAITPLVSGAVTVTTTANGTAHFEIEPFADEAWFHSGILDSTAARAASFRRHQQIPDPNADYKIMISFLNGATAPASNTNALLQFIAVQDYQELTAEITAGRGQTAAGQAMAVAVVSQVSTPVTGTVTANSIDQNNIFFNESITALAASATFTGTTRDVGVAAGAVHRYSQFNAVSFANVAGTLQIEASNDNVTWYLVASVAAAANAGANLQVPIAARYHRGKFINGATAQTTFFINTSFTAS